MTAAGTARGCPSWVPVKGWQDHPGPGGMICWTPPPSWWTPLHIAGIALLAVAAAGLLFLTVAVTHRCTGRESRCRCSGWPHAPQCPRSRWSRKEARP